MTEDIHLLLGSYVLGGLSAEDRRAFDDHLQSCSRCREELAQAAPLPALLRRVSGVPGLPTNPVVVEPSLDNLLISARARRKRQETSRWIATAAAVLLAFGGGAGAISLTHHSISTSTTDDAAQAQTVALAPSSGQEASGKVSLTRKEWGTSIWLQLADMPTSGVYTLWATDDKGHTELAATWGATGSGHCSLDGATSIQTDHLSQVSVVGPNHSVVAVAPV